MFPERDTVFDYFFQKVGSTWASWEDMIEKTVTIPPGAKVQLRHSYVQLYNVITSFFNANYFHVETLN